LGWTMRLRSFAAVVVLCSAALAADEPSVSEQLRALFELHQQGGLTAGEFTEAKAAVLRPPVRAVPDSSLPHPGAYTYNVLDYGADNTGRADSTAAINAAVTAASSAARVPCQPAYLCGMSVPTLWFPAGQYSISGPLAGDPKFGLSCSVRGDGHAVIVQTNSSSDIFVAEGLWRWELSGLTLVGGANQVHIGNNNINTGFYQISDMVFSNASNTSIRTTARTASTQVTISRCEFLLTQRVVVNHCDKMAFLDCWVEVGCPNQGDSGGPACIHGRAVFENYVALNIERMVGVPIPGGSTQEGLPGYNLRWIDNYGYIKAVDSRFGGEGGGITVVVNKASFLEPTPKPDEKSLPNGTKFSALPQGSTIILERCEVDSYGSARGVQPEFRSSIWLEQIPSVLIVRDSQGFAYAPAFGPPSNFSIVAVDPLLELDWQLEYAAQFENLLTFEIGLANNWCPTTYADLPEKLRGWIVGRVYGDGPPKAGHWRQNQFITARPVGAGSKQPAVMGWLCVAAGSPGSWSEIKPAAAMHAALKTDDSTM
jgi:hypothetical protein